MGFWGRLTWSLFRRIFLKSGFSHGSMAILQNRAVCGFSISEIVFRRSFGVISTEFFRSFKIEAAAARKWTLPYMIFLLHWNVTFLPPEKKRSCKTQGQPLKSGHLGFSGAQKNFKNGFSDGSVIEKISKKNAKSGEISGTFKILYWVQVRLNRENIGIFFETETPKTPKKLRRCAFFF